MAKKINTTTNKSNSRYPRLVTHIDADGFVAAVMMCAYKDNKYKEIVFTDYQYLNAGEFIHKKTDHVVDLPQPRNPIIKDKEVVVIDGKVQFEELVTGFWSDHHETGARGEYKGKHLFDPKAPSCAGLLYRNFVQEKTSLKRFENLIIGTDIVDSAGYRNAKDIYDMDNPAVVLRILTISKGLKEQGPGFREKTIRECADPEKEWTKIIYQPTITEIVQTTMKGFEQYRQYIKDFMNCEHGVISMIEEKRRPKNNGTKDRYYPFTQYPESMFLLGMTPSFIGKGYSISISENFLQKDETGTHPSKLVLGESIREIAKRVGMENPTAGGGHKGIGVFNEVPAEKVKTFVEECKNVLYQETKRLGTY